MRDFFFNLNFSNNIDFDDMNREMAQVSGFVETFLPLDLYSSDVFHINLW